MSDLAGSGTPALSNGPALSAAFNRPTGLALSIQTLPDSERLFIADTVSRCTSPLA